MNRSQKGLLFMLFGFCWPWHNAQLHCSHKELWICKVLWPFQWNNDSHNIRLETDWRIKWSEPSIVWKISHSHIKTFAYETLWSNCVKKKKKEACILRSERGFESEECGEYMLYKGEICACVFSALFSLIPVAMLLQFCAFKFIVCQSYASQRRLALTKALQCWNTLSIQTEQLALKCMCDRLRDFPKEGVSLLPSCCCFTACFV